jgi:hypothetical protein
MPWDWCWEFTKPNQSYPGTYLCDPERGIFGEEQYYYLNLIPNYNSSYPPVGIACS